LGRARNLAPPRGTRPAGSPRPEGRGWRGRPAPRDEAPRARSESWGKAACWRPRCRVSTIPEWRGHQQVAFPRLSGLPVEPRPSGRGDPGGLALRSPIPPSEATSRWPFPCFLPCRWSLVPRGGATPPASLSALRFPPARPPAGGLSPAFCSSARSLVPRGGATPPASLSALRFPPARPPAGGLSPGLQPCSWSLVPWGGAILRRRPLAAIRDHPARLQPGAPRSVILAPMGLPAGQARAAEAPRPPWRGRLPGGR
jgi:hypothetical protein